MTFHRIILLALLTTTPLIASAEDFVILSFKRDHARGSTIRPGQVFIPSENCVKAIGQYQGIPFSHEYKKFLSPKKSDALNLALNECSRPFSTQFRAYLRGEFAMNRTSMHHDGRTDALAALKSIFRKRITQQLMDETFGDAKATRLNHTRTTWVPLLHELFK